MANAESGQSNADSLFQHELSNDEKALRDLFVSEYLKDFDPFNATLRTGFTPAYAADWGKRLYQDRYVQSQIAFLTRKPSENQALQDIEDRELLKNTYRRIMLTRSDSSAVAAGRALAAMNGWEKPDGGAEGEEALIAILKGFAAEAPV